LQLAHVPEGEDEAFEPVISPYPHIYVVGDAADAFGALKAGHTAWGQAEIAADNVVALVKSTKSNKVWSFQQDVELRTYVPPPSASSWMETVEGYVECCFFWVDKSMAQVKMTTALCKRTQRRS
jgi:NADH dehydrogenase FAD-containing subunit